MKKTFITDILQSMMPYLNNAQLECLRQTLESKLQDFEIIESKDSCHKADKNNNFSLISSFIAAKRIEAVRKNRCSTTKTQFNV